MRVAPSGEVRACTRYDIRDMAVENDWELELASDDEVFDRDNPIRFYDVFRDRGSGDRVICEYTVSSRQLMVVELIMDDDPVRCVYWREGTRDKKQLAYWLLATDVVGRQGIAAHWTYGRDNWLAWREQNRSHG